MLNKNCQNLRFHEIFYVIKKEIHLCFVLVLIICTHGIHTLDNILHFLKLHLNTI